MLHKHTCLTAKLYIKRSMSEINNKKCSQEIDAVANMNKMNLNDDTDRQNSQSTNISVKVPKGTRDSSPTVLAFKDYIFDKIISTFKKHGAEQIDTPVFELRETLKGKYGEDSKLIYDLADQGGEMLSLRYDLTVPLARYVAMNKLDRIKRYHIAKVYRRDNPAMNRGRFREFYQCDYDICGSYDPLLPDVECCKVVCEILQKLSLGTFVGRVNHRQILDGYLKISGVRDDQIRPISSSIDKLDKLSWENVQKEMIEEKGLSPMVADKIKNFVCLSGGKEIIETLRNNPDCQNDASFAKGLNEMELFFQYSEVLKIDKYIKFDLSLARGLDYYTGCIFEFIITHAPYLNTKENFSVGSVAGGGRYDGLIGMFSAKNRQVSAVGISLGVERLQSLLEKKLEFEGKKLRTRSTQVFVASTSKDMLITRLQILQLLWEADICAETTYKKNTKILTDFQYCEENLVPICVVIGPTEYENNLLIVRDVATRAEEKIPIEIFIEKIKLKLLLNK